MAPAAAEPPSRKRPGLEDSLWAPVVAGLLMDALDLATFGPVGLWTGFAVGGLAGWLLAGSLGHSERVRWLTAAASGLYCMLPFTAFLPLGTLAGLLVKLHRQAPRPAAGAGAEGGGEAPAIDAEYRSRWHEE